MKNIFSKNTFLVPLWLLYDRTPFCISSHYCGKWHKVQKAEREKEKPRSGVRVHTKKPFFNIAKRVIFKFQQIMKGISHNTPQHGTAARRKPLRNFLLSRGCSIVAVGVWRKILHYYCNEFFMFQQTQCQRVQKFFFIFLLRYLHKFYTKKENFFSFFFLSFSSLATNNENISQ